MAVHTGEWNYAERFEIEDSMVPTEIDMRFRTNLEAGIVTVILLPLEIIKKTCPKLVFGILAEETSVETSPPKNISRDDLFGLQVLQDIYKLGKTHAISQELFEDLGFYFLSSMSLSAVDLFAEFLIRNNAETKTICEIAINSNQPQESPSQKRTGYLAIWLQHLMAAGKMPTIGPFFRLAGNPGVVKVAGDALSHHLSGICSIRWNVRMLHIPNLHRELTAHERAVKIIARYGRVQEKRIRTAQGQQFRCPFFYKLARELYPNSYRGAENWGYCDAYFAKEGLRAHLEVQHDVHLEILETCGQCGERWILPGGNESDKQCFLADHDISCSNAIRKVGLGWEQTREVICCTPGMNKARAELSTTAEAVLNGWRDVYRRTGMKVYGEENLHVGFVVY